MSEENETPEVAEEVAVDPAPAQAPSAQPAHGHGIKDTREMLKALDVLAEFVGKVLADGQINGADLISAVDLFQKFSVFSDAFMGVKNIDDEIKDLDQAELIVLGTEAYKLVKKIHDAVKKK